MLKLCRLVVLSTVLYIVYTRPTIQHHKLTCYEVLLVSVYLVGSLNYDRVLQHNKSMKILIMN